MARYECSVCGYIYDEEKEGKKWEELPDDWVCPACDSDKSYFNLLEEEAGPESTAAPGKKAAEITGEKSAPKQMICSVCGYIVKAGFHGEVCPACGFPRTAFQPYTDKVSEKRRKILDLHMHNILVHFPQGFSLLMLFLIFASFFIQGSLKLEFMTTAKILSIFLPLSVLVSIASGILDGKNRFKRIDTPVIKRKIIVAILFLIVSLGVFLLFNVLNIGLLCWLWLKLLLTGFCAVCSLVLGYNGGRLSGAIVPG